MSVLFTLFATDAPPDVDVPLEVSVEVQVSRLLNSPDRKSRMAAYAYVYAGPDPLWIGKVVEAVIVESTRFGQYWGARALRRQVQADPTALDAFTRRRLENFVATLEPESDGARELVQLLGESPA